MRRYSSLSVFIGTVAVCGCAYANSASGCDSKLLDSIRQAERVVYSLHPDKPGQTRVVASDLTEYTGGQTLWLRGEMHAVNQACIRNDADDAVERLGKVQLLLRAHGSLKPTAT